MTMTGIEQDPGPERAAYRRRPPWWVVVALAAVLAIVTVVAVAALRGGRDPDPGAPVVPSTSAPPTTSASAPSTTAASAAPATTPPGTAPPTSAPAPVSAVTAVWPDAAGPTRYADARAAARGFATSLVGFRDPVVGPYLAGDSRSGEVEVRPRADGPVTTVLVRLLEDDTWWVLGAVSGQIQLDVPAAGTAVTSPVTLAGRALAFEGQVDVRIVEDGGATPLATGFVTGGGDELRPFSGTFTLDRSPASAHGAVVLSAASAENGEVWQASVVRIGFGG
jgi:hypothetical protein